MAVLQEYCGKLWPFTLIGIQAVCGLLFWLATEVKDKGIPKPVLVFLFPVIWLSGIIGLFPTGLVIMGIRDWVKTKIKYTDEHVENMDARLSEANYYTTYWRSEAEQRGKAAQQANQYLSKILSDPSRAEELSRQWAAERKAERPG